MKNRVIIFDFDGVIVDSIQLAYSIHNGMMPDLEYNEWQSWFEGNPYKNISKELTNSNSLEIFFDRYNKGVVNITPIKGMSEVVQELAKKYTLVIISSSSEKSINAYLKKYNLDNCFQDILGKETHRGKVEKFHMIFDKYKIDPDETLIITDSVGDIREANEVGVRSLGVIWGVHNAKKLKEASPHFIATEPSEIINGINSVLNH